jgi:phage gp46-like protein
MARGIDAVLQRLEGGAFDIKVGADGDIETADFFDTAIYVSLFSDRRANESEVLESHRRRGWIGNEYTPGFEGGSKLWLFEQSRLTRTVVNEVEDAAREALQWFVDDEFAVAIRKSDLRVTTTGLSLEIVIERPYGKVEKRYFELWEGTGLPSSS